MIILASDLDNTLIYSQRRFLEGDKRCIEIYKDKNISYMTEKTIELLKELQNHIMFIPITTRSRIDFLRIDFSSVRVPRYALVCNGGMLLVDNQIDEDWYRESLKMIKDSVPVLKQAMDLLEKDEFRTLDVRFVEKLFVFTKTSEPKKTIQMLKNHLNKGGVYIFSYREKVYVLPKILNKGIGILRLKNLLKAEKIIVAGDNVLDIPMLKKADSSYFPEEIYHLCNKIKHGHCIYKSEGNFSDKMLERIFEKHIVHI